MPIGTPTRSQSWKATPAAATSRAVAGSRVVVDPAHAEKLHAREPGDLRGARCSVWPVREGHRPHADMHAAEESDSGVVPMNQPNKGGRPPAEVGEGRPEIKENIAQSHTRPTQSGVGVSQGLSGVRQRAKERKPEKFTALLHHLTVDLLRESYFALQRRAAPGIDGETWLRSVLQGFYRYHAVPGNLRALSTLRHRLGHLWRSTLRHRGQRPHVSWERLGPLFARWLPAARVLHPYPSIRFDATHPR